MNSDSQFVSYNLITKQARVVNYLIFRTLKFHYYIYQLNLAIGEFCYWLRLTFEIGDI